MNEETVLCWYMHKIPLVPMLPTRDDQPDEEEALLQIAKMTPVLIRHVAILVLMLPSFHGSPAQCLWPGASEHQLPVPILIRMTAHMPSIHAQHPVDLLNIALPEQLLTQPAPATASGDWHWNTTYATDKLALPGFDTQMATCWTFGT